MCYWTARIINVAIQETKEYRRSIKNLGKARVTLGFGQLKKI